ncbi:hypothetical protein [Algibacter mikhailovii]|uniref:hypothetical protein n=1 Tax=Algibacter mikhailovii TaxID=425498 RepID=UPI0024942D29|nr:hypothetical protein [Algibacter mikhailovii]
MILEKYLYSVLHSLALFSLKCVAIDGIKASRNSKELCPIEMKPMLLFLSYSSQLLMTIQYSKVIFHIVIKDYLIAFIQNLTANRAEIRRSKS